MVCLANLLELLIIIYQNNNIIILYNMYVMIILYYRIPTRLCVTLKTARKRNTS